MTKRLAVPSLAVLIGALGGTFACIEASDNQNGGGGGSGGSSAGAGGSGGSGTAGMGGGAGSTAGSGGSGGASAGGSGGAAGAGLGGSGGGAAGAGGMSGADAGTAGAGGSMGGAGGAMGGAGGAMGGAGGMGASDPDAAYFKSNCAYPVFSGFSPKQFCAAYAEICGFSGQDHYTSVADCMSKFQGGSNDGDACKSGHLCGAFKMPDMKEALCRSSGTARCSN